MNESLTGFTYVIALLAAGPALLITWFLLRRYRRAVIRLMNQRATARPQSGVELQAPDRARSPNVGSGAVGDGLRRNLVVVVTIGILGGLAFGALNLRGFDVAIRPLPLVFFAAVYSWPTVLGVWIVTGFRRRWVLGSVLVYFAVLGAVGIYIAGSPTDPFVLWAWSLVPTLAILAFMTRPLRGVGPLVLGVVMAVMVGALWFAGLITGSEVMVDAWIRWYGMFGSDSVTAMAIGVWVFGLLFGLVLGGTIAWLLAWWYAQRGFSDQMLLLGAVFLVFVVDYTVTIDPENFSYFLVGIGIFVALAIVALLLYRLVHRRASETASLLVLRVFSRQRGAQRLLDRIDDRWRYLGPVRMIGGPDLATHSVEPPEFLYYVTARLWRLFIADPAQLLERLDNLRAVPDPDGRHRVDEFFCYDDTWEMTVAQLLARSDAVVMDLRGLTAERQGSLEELHLLADQEALRRTVLLVDGTTDHSVLDSALPGDSEQTPEILDVSVVGEADEVVRHCLEAVGRGAAPAPK